MKFHKFVSQFSYYLFLDVCILTKFPKYNMKDETSKLIQKMKPGKQELLKTLSFYTASWT